MTRAEKQEIIESLKQDFSNASMFYITDSSTLTVEQVNRLRGMCFDKGVKMKVAKNTLIIKALEALNNDTYNKTIELFKGPTTLLFTDVSNAPAKIIKEFRKKSEKPLLKGAYIESDIFIGEEELDTLANLKSKEELVGEIIALLQSPVQRVIGSLQSGGQQIVGVLKTLAEKSDDKSEN